MNHIAEDSSDNGESADDDDDTIEPEQCSPTLLASCSDTV
jgi:hypothetical protein